MRNVMALIRMDAPIKLKVQSENLTRLNKTAIPNYKFPMTGGQGSHWRIESPKILLSFYSVVRYMSTLFKKHIHTTSIKTII